jgi:hypothetical protein
MKRLMFVYWTDKAAAAAISVPRSERGLVCGYGSSK